MKSPAYGKVRILLKEGGVNDFREIASDIKRKVLSADLGMHPRTLRRRVNDPGEWTIAELRRLADLLGVDHGTLFALADKISIEVEKAKELAKAKKKGKR